MLLSNAAEESPSTKRKSPEKNNNDGTTAKTTDEPEPKKANVTSLGIPAVKEDGKKYYQCKMSGCLKVRIIFLGVIAVQLIIYVHRRPIIIIY